MSSRWNVRDVTVEGAERDADRGPEVFILRCVGLFPIVAATLLGASAVGADVARADDWEAPRGSP